ncbi:hypothetical protein WMY93_001019 [Mugilogobius chulae]|uniref:Uncharacterized protein n=1 Tax=Mugilogobius chulae TaxID=88201 RepID=A0AAW0Q0Z8_9GOBI
MGRRAKNRECPSLVWRGQSALTSALSRDSSSICRSPGVSLSSSAPGQRRGDSGQRRGDVQQAGSVRAPRPHRTGGNTPLRPGQNSGQLRLEQFRTPRKDKSERKVEKGREREKEKEKERGARVKERVRKKG